MATVYYKGLTGVRDSVTGITFATTTIDQLVTAIAADEGLPADYYKISLDGSPGVNDIVYGDSSTKLDAIGFTDGCTVICTTKQVGSKEERQIQKLTIAAKARANDSNSRYAFDISELPTKYVGNTVYDNVNEGGLVQGRPWATTETPNSISGLSFWIDTATTSTLNSGTYTDGAALTSWRERKQNAAYVNPAANRRGTIQSGAGDLQNGYPVVRHAFAVAGDWDQAEWTSVSGFANATGYTMVCVAKLSPTPLGTALHLFRIRNTSGTYSTSVYYNTTSGRFEMAAPTNGALVDTAIDPDDTWKIVTVRYDSTAAAASRFTFRWAKTARTVTNNGTPSGALAADAGSNVMVGFFWNADFGEMMVYNTALSDAQIIALEDYLSSKWGV